MKKLVLYILFILSSVVSVAQQLPMTVHFNANNGLKQHTVFAIQEDVQGRIWIGTSGGLQYYTGYEIVDFSEVDEKVLKLHKTISALYCTTISGIYKIDFSTLKTKKFIFDKMDYSSPTFKEDVIEIKIYERGTKIILDYDLNKLFSKEEIIHRYSETYSFDFGKYHLISDEKGVYYINTDSVYILKSHSIGYTQINNNKAFLSTFEGLVEINLKDDEIEKKVYFPKTRIECSLLDRNDNLWVGTAENGIFMIHRNMLKSKFYPIEYTNGDPVPCWGIFEIDGALYSGSSNGIIKLDNDLALDSYEKSVGNKTIFSGISNENFILLGTALEGVLKLKDGILEQVYFNEEESHDCMVLQIIQNEKGFLAITKLSFIQLDHEGNFMFTKKYDFSRVGNYVMEIQKAEEGYLISTTNGIYLIDLDLKIIRKYDSNFGRVFSMTKTFQDNTWAVSSDNGLFTIQEDSLLAVPVKYQQMFSLANIDDKELWLGAYSGIYQYNDTMYRPYEFENGFPLREYNQNGFFQNDNLYYGGLGGVFEFNVDSVQYVPESPSVLVKKNNEYLDFEKEITLNYDQSEFVFTLEPIMLADKNLFKIEYKINNNWKEITSTSQIAEPVIWGENELIIQVLNKVSGEKKISRIQIHRQQPFWTTLAFKIGTGIVCIFLLLGIYSFVKFLQTRIKLRKEQAQKKLTQERLRISSELHDNIGSRLTHIISSLDIEMYQKKENVSSIENINSFARETMTQLRETIWAVSEKAIFFSEFSRRVEQYIDQVDSMTKTNVTFYSDKIIDFELNPVQTINFYRIIQESINNAIKYSSAEDIKVEIVKLPDNLMITIEDNGVGFDTNKARSGTGLTGMEKRAVEAGARIEIESNQGVMIKLII